MIDQYEITFELWYERAISEIKFSGTLSDILFYEVLATP